VVYGGRLRGQPGRHERLFLVRGDWGPVLGDSLADLIGCVEMQASPTLVTTLLCRGQRACRRQCVVCV
jgi:hypothetical protein